MPRRKNDGKGKTGGRAKGTPNKITASVRELLSAAIYNNRERIAQDLRTLDPKARLAIMAKLAQYFIPKRTYSRVR